MKEAIFVSRREHFDVYTPTIADRHESEDIGQYLKRLTGDDLIALEDDILGLLRSNVVTTRLEKALGCPSALRKARLLLV